MTDKDLAILKSVQRSLRHIDKMIEGLKESPGENMFDKLTENQKAEYIIERVCSFYEIPREELLKKAQAGTLAQRRRYAGLFMRDHTMLEWRVIAEKLGFNNHSNAKLGVDRLRERVSNMAYGDGRQRAIYKSMAEYIGVNPVKY